MVKDESGEYIEYFCTLNETLVSCKIVIIACRMMLYSIYREYLEIGL